MTGGNREEYTARNRLSPPSTGSTYTMSAAFSPVCGRARTMLSIFTASTGPREVTGSPVNGEVSGPVAAAGEVAGLPGRAGAGALAIMKTMAVTPAATPTTTPPIPAYAHGCRPTLATTACQYRAHQCGVTV